MPRILTAPRMARCIGCDSCMLAMGRRIYDERVRLRERLGFRASAGDVPRRFYETPTPRGQLQPERVANLLALYEQKRGQS